MSKIVDINALEILDSRGNPTVEVEIYNNIHEKASWKERLFKRFKKDEKEKKK